MDVTNDVKAIAKDLSKWANEEMHFKCVTQTDNTKLSSDLFPACKGSVMIELWNEITKRVKTKKTANNIRDNISLQQLIEDNKEVGFHIENQEIELEALEREVEILELEKKKCQRALQNSNLRLADTQETIKLRQIQSCMMRRNAETFKSLESEFSSFQQQFEERSNADFDKMVNTSGNNHCYQEIQIICSYLEEENAGTVTQPAQSDNIVHDVGFSVENLLANYSPDTLVSSLQRLTEINSAKIKEEETSINIEKDLEEIEKKLHPNEDDNEARASPVQKMLRLWDLECVEKYTDSLVCDHNADNSIEQCEDVTDKIIRILEKIYREDLPTLQLALDDLDAGLLLANVNGCLESFLSSYTSLQEDFERKTKEQSHLTLLGEKIDISSASLEANEKEIIFLVKHNSSVKSEIFKEQDRVHSDAIKTICKRGGELSKASLELADSLHKHKNALSLVNLENLRVVEFNGDEYKPVNELSINRFGKISNNFGGFAYQRSLDCVNIVNHSMPSSCLSRIAHMKTETNELSRSENQQENRSGEAQYQRLSAHIQKAVDLEKQQLDAHGGYFKTGLKLSQNSAEHSESFGKTIQAWYDQPGQYQIPWLRYEGLSLEEWKEKVKNNLHFSTDFI